MENKLTIIGKVIAIISFIIGTILFLTFLNNKDSILIIQIGFGFLVISIIINSIFFIILIVYALRKYPYRKPLLTSAAIMLINIPVATIYLYVIFTFYLGY